LTGLVSLPILGGVRPWDKHPPWAHWSFYSIWAITGSVGPIALFVSLINGSTEEILVGIVLCLICAGSLVVDWLLVRWLRRHVDGWTPWRPPHGRWLRG
jgi:hypothetical protein